MISDGRLHTNINRIFRDGYLAFKRNKSKSILTNPYEKHAEVSRTAWHDGYCWAISAGFRR